MVQVVKNILCDVTCFASKFWGGDVMKIQASRTWWIGGILVLMAGAGCRLVSSDDADMAAPVVPDHSPVLMATETHPWRSGLEIARHVPNSDVLVGHGDSLLPLYPDGTVLVVQTIQLMSLRPGMTVVFMGRAGDPFSLKAQILVKHYEDGRWLVAGLEPAAPRSRGRLDESNYIGVVVAALRRAEGAPLENPIYLTEARPTCTLQCHIDGAVHPRIIPTMQMPANPPLKRND